MKVILPVLSLLVSVSVLGNTGISVSKNLWVEAGAVNTVRVGYGDDTAWIYQSKEESAEADVSRLLLTHGRRDVLPSNPERFERWQVFAPDAERSLLESPHEFWESFRTKRFHDYEQQSTKVLAEPFPVDRWLNGGEQLDLAGMTLVVVKTPGYTRGSISYFGVIDGLRTAFTGDLLYKGGRIIDLYSFQDAIPEAQIRGYHGYAARLADLIESLRILRALKLDLIVPARGPLIKDPQSDIDQLIVRAQKLYRNYLSTNALNWYFKEDRMRLSGERVLGEGADIQLMPYSTHLETPDWILSQSTSRLIVSDEGYGFLLDCGYQAVIQAVEDWIKQGLVRKIEGIFVTHFHDDHADMVQKAADLFDCPVYALSEYKDVLENPSAYHLPAMTSNPIAPVTEMRDGQEIRWREFDLTFQFYPGQALYHGALMVEKADEEPVFFIGDSFSPSGIDDYCLLNRNLMQENTGYFLCLKKLREISGEYWLINEHIPHIFRFSDLELVYMEQRYKERHAILAELFPWDDPNYGIDEQWAVFYPYGAEMNPGGRQVFEIRVTNHSPVRRVFSLNPKGDGAVSIIGERPLALELAARESGAVRFEVLAPREPGNYLLTADLISDDLRFDNWIEAMIRVD